MFACPALTTVVFPTCTQVWYHKSVDEGAEYKSIAIDTKLAGSVYYYLKHKKRLTNNLNHIFGGAF